MENALADGADPMATDQNGRPIAFYAASSNDPRALSLLLDRGLDLHVTSSDGSLLHRAASFGRVKTIEMLLARGIAVGTKDSHGKTALDHARAWKHGKEAVPLLASLMKAVRKGRTGRVAEDGGDLDYKAAVEALELAASRFKTEPFFKHTTKKAVKELLAGFFAELDPRRTTTFLQEACGQDHEGMIATALVIAKASRAAPSPRALPALGDGEVIHIGDLTIDRDADVPSVLVVTGNLNVNGKLSNHEGTVVAVGGDLTARAIWSEGPFVVGGDVRVEQAVWCAYNDYGMRIRGGLRAPMLVIDDHFFTARSVDARRYDRIAQIPPDDRNALLATLGPIGALDG